MTDVSCTLVSTTFTSDDIGNQVESKTLLVIPIIKVEDVWQDEFYRASQQGMKPSLRLRISTLNYNDQRELIYMNNTYTIIRSQTITADETVLVCERKIGDE